MSPKFGLLCQTKPKNRQSVNCSCGKCGATITIIFRDLIRSTNKHISLGLSHFHCKECLYKSDEYRNMHRINSKKALDKITAGSSDRSKRLWRDDEYRQKMLANHNRLSSDKEFAAKVSSSLSFKFANDEEYVKKIRIARSKYWQNHQYKDTRCWDLEKFVSEAQKIHGDKYIYDLVEYTNIKEKVVIVCKEHGQFHQRPSHHIFYENGCPECSKKITESKPQLEIAKWIESFGLRVEVGNRSVLNGLELDILVDDKFAIEYNGCFWHSYNTIESTNQRQRHSRKVDLALQNNITLFQITDLEWLKRNDIVKSMILQRLGISESVYARKCRFQQLDSDTARVFFDENHISGHRAAKFYFGLVCDGNLLSSISFSPMKNGYYEIIRFCSLRGVTVVGGLSKMLANVPFNKLFTYADRRYSTAIGYMRCGFKLIGVTKPGYEYWRNNRLYSRIKFQKHKLPKVLSNYDPSKTEAENMFAHGYRRLWDSGHYRLINEN